MYYDVVVLSADAVFARLLELEISNLRLGAVATVSLLPTDRAELILLDLDSASAPLPDQYRKMIGFSRRSAMTSPDARSCAMILRRPFRMSLLRREILGQLEQSNDLAQPFYRAANFAKRQISLDVEERMLICDGQKISLTPTEYAILECFLEHRGSPVSRDLLCELLGASGEGNEADVYVCYLRRKTDGLPGGRLIQTVRGKGYQIP